MNTLTKLVSLAGDERAEYACKPDEVAPGALRTRLRWDWQQDAVVAEVMREHGLSLPKDRELIRQVGGHAGCVG